MLNTLDKTVAALLPLILGIWVGLGIVFATLAAIRAYYICLACW